MINVNLVRDWRGNSPDAGKLTSWFQLIHDLLTKEEAPTLPPHSRYPQIRNPTAFKPLPLLFQRTLGQRVRRAFEACINVYFLKRLGNLGSKKTHAYLRHAYNVYWTGLPKI